MATTPHYRRIALLPIVALFLVTALFAQQNEKPEVSLIIDPIRVTLNAGQTQKFSAHLEGAPTSTSIIWIIPDREKVLGSITEDGVFTARAMGVYHVVAIAAIKDVTLTHAVAKVTVLGQLER